MQNRTLPVETKPAPRYRSIWSRNRRLRRRIGSAITVFALVCVSVVLMLPVLWMVSSSLKQEWEIFRVPPTLVPLHIRWANYPEALAEFRFLPSLRNTLIITCGAVLGQLLSASMAAFAFSRLRFRLREPLFILVLATLMIPSQVTLIPTYILFRILNWLNTFLPLIVPGWLGGGAFNIFLLRQFFLSIPREMDEAARIDGCSTFRLYWNIILPMSTPALATVGIFSFLGHWNDFFEPLIYLNDSRRSTLAIALQFYRQSINQSVGPTITWSHLMVVTLIVMLPCLIIFFSAQRVFMQGIVITGVKG